MLKEWELRGLIECVLRRRVREGQEGVFIEFVLC